MLTFSVIKAMYNLQKFVLKKFEIYVGVFNGIIEIYVGVLMVFLKFEAKGCAKNINVF